MIRLVRRMFQFVNTATFTKWVAKALNSTAGTAALCVVRMTAATVSE